VEETVPDWLYELVADIYDESIVKLVQYLDNHLNHNMGYIEK
jgi:hypothetical protein